MNNFINNDTNVSIKEYINEMCEKPDFLCNNSEYCATHSTLFDNKNYIDQQCKEQRANAGCERNFESCLISVFNKFTDPYTHISTTFKNIIIPIKDAKDHDGFQMFIRLPDLKSAKKENSLEPCNICACVSRFAQAGGGGKGDPSVTGYTSPGQDTCEFIDFDYFYYPLEFEDKSFTLLKNKPSVILPSDSGVKYEILNKNIIQFNSSDDLEASKLKDILVNQNGISDYIVNNFISQVLYKNNTDIVKQYTNASKSTFGSLTKFGSLANNDIYYILFIILFITLIYFLIKK